RQGGIPERDAVPPDPLCYERPMDLLTRFAGNVRRLRSKKKLSQKALADKVGISVSYVSMLERGQRSPPLETIEKMAKALGVPPASLLGGGK
ncbi:MAG TPA: helix-turn-helix transcriptional regulator, partial [Anaeromyxobacteraceae bacterium]|nr:helix-turn-helix transcriptional regulator [Anaeromyxobacteraceae bacterium]